MIRVEINEQQFNVDLRYRTDGVMAAIDAALWRGAEELAREMRRKSPKAFSHLANSIGVRRDGLAEFSVGSGMEYARMADEGTGPGGSPTDQSIRDWIRVTGLVPQHPGMNEDDLVFVIIRKIRSRGTPATEFAAKSLTNKRQRITDLVRTAAQRSLS